MNKLRLESDEQRFRDLVKTLGLPLKFLPEILELPADKVLLWWSGVYPTAISERHFHRLAQSLGLQESALTEDHLQSLNLDLAKRRLTQGIQSLPERYSKNQNSHLRTSAHIVRYMTLTRGAHFTSRILANLNMSAQVYKDPNAKINLTYFVDLLTELKKNSFSQKEHDCLSSVMFLGIHETALGKEFAQCTNTFEVYEILNRNFHNFDTNFTYKMDFRGRHIYLKTEICLDHHEHLKENPGGVQDLMRYRHLLLGWFPFLARQSPLLPLADSKIENNTLTTQYQIELSRGVKLRVAPASH
jgi:hypothetical protein